MKKEKVTLYLRPGDWEWLLALSRETRVPTAEYVREGVARYVDHLQKGGAAFGERDEK